LGEGELQMTQSASESRSKSALTPTLSRRERGKKGRVLRFARRAAAAVMTVPLAGWLTFRAAVAWCPYPEGIAQDPPSSTRIDGRNGTPLAAFVAADGQWRIHVSEDDISPHLLHAIVAVEDARFESHGGVDWRSAAAAAWQDLCHFSLRRGASTLTMQLQRLRDPRPHTLLNKLEQAIRAEQIERRETKGQILVEYVNRAPFGGNLVGAGAASWRYFGHSCRQLSLGEAAMLAGLPQSPNRLRPDRYPLRAKARRDHVLDRMLACGFITQAQRDEAAAEPIAASWRPLPQTRVDGALPAMVRLAQDRPGHLIRSTLDATVQRQAAATAREQLESMAGSGISAIAVVVLDTQTAECLAAVSLGAESPSLDLTCRPRSTGSTLKPFIYAAAFDAGLYGPRSILSDSPAAWPGYEPNDFDRTFRGKLTAAEALAESRNIPAMVVLSKVGIGPAIGVMDGAGLHGLAQSPERYGLSLAIGGAEASPMEIAEAYAMLGRGGVPREIRMTVEPELPTGSSHLPSPGVPGEGIQTSLPEGSGVPSRVLRSSSCWAVLNAIADVHRTTGVCPEAARSHVAWKTGTSSGRRDAWCAAVTPRRTVVVWMGNAGGQGSPALVGQEAAAPLALRLIAMLDPIDEPWPIAPEESTLAREPRTNGERELILVHPTNGEQFVLTPDAPRDRQRVLLEAAQRGAHSRLWWFVDGAPLEARSDADQVWWDPVAGTHEIRVIDDDGHGAMARIGVRSRGE
jgi:penicillin-binding protein 1C